jgi:hypothetical protein
MKFIKLFALLLANALVGASYVIMLPIIGCCILFVLLSRLAFNSMTNAIRKNTYLITCNFTPATSYMNFPGRHKEKNSRKSTVSNDKR